jgi:protein-tyrosine phosphatase
VSTSRRKRIAVSFVCMGNICRSPTAEAIMRHLVHQAGLDEHIEVDSAGTGAWHVGEDRDPRSHAAAARRAMPLSGVARQFVRADFQRFDYVLALDRENRAELVRLSPDDTTRAKVHLLRDFDPGAPANSDVPDPYYGGAEGFEQVFDICLGACRGLLDHLRRTHRLG